MSFAAKDKLMVNYMKRVNLDKCETANDAYLALKREKEPCFGKFNRVWVYANVENPPHEN